LFSFKGDIVLDPFNGVGTTTVVAKKFGRKFVGIDISKEYCDIANKRIESTLF
jgi:DNA modification methylase